TATGCKSLTGNGPRSERQLLLQDQASMLPDVTRERLKAAIACACFAGGFVLLYHRIILKLAHDWATDDNYSHGLLVAPIAAYLAWQRRGALKSSVTDPRNGGLAIVAGSLVVLAAGVLGSELFLSRVSM